MFISFLSTACVRCKNSTYALTFKIQNTNIFVLKKLQVIFVYQNYRVTNREVRAKTCFPVVASSPSYFVYKFLNSCQLSHRHKI